MPITTVAVTCTAARPDGSLIAGGKFRFLLSNTDTENGLVVPREISATANASGVAVANLWPNSLGALGTQYRVLLSDPLGSTIDLGSCTVPTLACNLHAILGLGTAPTLDQATVAKLAAQTAAAASSTSATQSASSATQAATSATAAAGSATGAANSATTAAGSVTSAANSATAAGNSATSAASSNTAAGASATSAATSATDALSSKNAAATSATNSASSATSAQTSATNSATSASTATTKAGEAATSANNSATSEAAALASKNAAATSETNAQGAATTSATQASNAASSATNAASSATNAASSATSAASSLAAVAAVTTGNMSSQNANDVAITGGAISGTSITVTDNVFTLQDNVDPSKQARFELSGLATNTTCTYGLPNVSSTIAVTTLGQTFSGVQSFIAANGNFVTGATTGTTNLGSGANASGVAKFVNLGTGGLSGSTTNITVGATAGASTTTMNGQVDLGGTTTSVNFARIVGAATGAAPTISAQGSDADISLVIAPKGTGVTRFTKPIYMQRSYGTGSLIGLGGNTAYSVGANASGFDNDVVIDSTKTSSYASYSTYLSTAAAGFTLFALRHYSAQFFQLGAGSAVTNQYGFFTDNSLIGATNNYGFFSGIAAATGRFNFYANGTAANVFVGNTTIGGTIGTQSLQVNNVTSAVNYVQAVGSVTNGGVLTAAAPELSAQGSDANINLKLTPKGTGVLQFGTYTAGVVAQAGFITITDAGGTSRRLLVG